MNVNDLRNKFFKEYGEKTYDGFLDPHENTQFKALYVEWLEDLYLKNQENIQNLVDVKNSDIFQITVVEKNHWEGETFNYILHVTEDEYNKIKKYCDNISGKVPATYSVLENTKYTMEEVKELDAKSKNGYMDEYAFYKLPEKVDFCSDTVFYKSGVLIKIK